MEITRHEIVSVLHEGFASNSKVLVLWLEGAAGAQKMLETCAPLDLVETLHAGEDYQHKVFHLAGTSLYLLVDFNLFVGRGSDFIEGDEIGKPFVLFDQPGQPPITEAGTGFGLYENWFGCRCRRGSRGYLSVGLSSSPIRLTKLRPAASHGAVATDPQHTSRQRMPGQKKPDGWQAVGGLSTNDRNTRDGY